MEWNTDSALELSTIMERVTTILDEDDMCVLGTVEEQGPRLTPCFFAPLGDHRLVFVSSKGARHVANAQADPRCSALVVPRRPQGRPVSVHLSGPVTRPRGGSRLAALTAYAARMSGRLSSAANGVHDLLDKRVFVLETERIDYQMALEDARRTGNKKLVDKLEEQRPPPYESGIALKTNAYLSPLYGTSARTGQLRGATFSTMDGPYGVEYGLLDKVAFFWGLYQTFDSVYGRLYPIDLRQSAAEQQIPVHIFHGRYDYDAPTSLVED